MGFLKGSKNELAIISDGYKYLEKKNTVLETQLKEFTIVNDLIDSLQLSGEVANSQIFLLRMNDEMTRLKAENTQEKLEKDATLRAMSKFSVELQNLSDANASLSDEVAKYKVLVAETKADMYEMLHSESKDTLGGLADAKGEIADLKSEKIELMSQLKVAKAQADRVPDLQAKIDALTAERDSLSIKLSSAERDLKIFKAQTVTSVSDSDDEDMLLS